VRKVVEKRKLFELRHRRFFILPTDYKSAKQKNAVLVFSSIALC